MPYKLAVYMTRSMCLLFVWFFCSRESNRLTKLTKKNRNSHAQRKTAGFYVDKENCNT